MVASMRKDLIIVKTLWDLANIVQTTLDEWQGTLWADINTGMMEEESKTMAKLVKGMDHRLVAHVAEVAHRVNRCLPDPTVLLGGRPLKRLEQRRLGGC